MEIEKIVKEIRGVLKKQRGLKEDSTFCFGFLGISEIIIIRLIKKIYDYFLAFCLRCYLFEHTIKSGLPTTKNKKLPLRRIFIFKTCPSETMLCLFWPYLNSLILQTHNDTAAGELSHGGEALDLVDVEGRHHITGDSGGRCMYVRRVI